LASGTVLSDVANAVIANIDNAFYEHEQELKTLSSSHRKFFGRDVSRWITFGGLSIAAASTGNAGLAVLAAAVGIVGAPAIPDLWKRWRELRSKAESLSRSPAGILFRTLKQKFGFSS
jgi:hypothetical protein